MLIEISFVIRRLYFETHYNYNVNCADSTPPKTVLSKELRLFEANCVPSAILHFGSDDKQLNYLKDDILDKISSPKASLMQALTDRYVYEFGSNIHLFGQLLK